MILCRTTAPAVRFAFDLIKTGKQAYVRGRDIGVGFIRQLDVIEKVKGFKYSEFPEFVDGWRCAKIESLKQDDDTARKVADIDDQAETMLAVYEFCKTAGGGTVSDMRTKITLLFTDKSEAICCSTVHRAKGLEAQNVFILRHDLMPFPKAKGRQIQQEENLRYVAYTRAMSNLFIVKG
jgi:superfamily I DNA/RNA helicase